MLLRRATKAAGIDDYRATRISDYDFRHSAATHLGRSSNNLPGVMYLLGHKQPATTARYMRPQKDAAAEVLKAAAAARAIQILAEYWPSHGKSRLILTGRPLHKTRIVPKQCEDGDSNPDGC